MDSSSPYLFLLLIRWNAPKSCGECLFSALSAQTNTDSYMFAYDPVLRHNILKASKGKLVDGTCPVCRKPIKGGWGSAARGLEWKTEKKKKKKVVVAEAAAPDPEKDAAGAT